MSQRIDSILSDSGGTMILWLGLMTTTQYSLARCTVPSVSQLYEKLLLNFQNEKKFDIYSRDKNVLGIFYIHVYLLFIYLFLSYYEWI